MSKVALLAMIKLVPVVTVFRRSLYLRLLTEIKIPWNTMPPTFGRMSSLGEKSQLLLETTMSSGVSNMISLQGSMSSSLEREGRIFEEEVPGDRSDRILVSPRLLQSKNQGQSLTTGTTFST